MSKIVQNRYEAVLFCSVKNGNPNGDPDAGNKPRVNPENDKGIITDVCLKRKVRNYVTVAKENEKGYDLYIEEGSVLTEQNTKAYEEMSIPVSKKIDEKTVIELQNTMCNMFYDIRTFGAVMVGSVNLNKLQGPLQMTFAESLDIVEPVQITVTRCAKTNKKDDEDNKTMGNKWYIPYALYRTHIFVNPKLAEKTGFTEDDLDLFWKSLINMFDFDRSAARGEMTTQGLKVFKHYNKLGVYPSHKQLERVTTDENYNINVNLENLPEGIEYIDMW